MKSRTISIYGAIALVLVFFSSGLAAWADDPRPGRIITIDVPGSIFTNAVAMTPAGVITGFFDQADHTIRSFVREPDGTLTLFDAPGAGSGVGFGTNAFSINARGDIAGYVRDASGVFHGFVRTRGGKFTTFDVPGAGTASLQGTSAWDINAEGEIAGEYADAAYVFHAFVRDPGGLITTFDAPGAGVGPYQGTFVSSADGLNAGKPAGRTRWERRFGLLCLSLLATAFGAPATPRVG